jgi:hypothetical protein
MRRRHPDEPDIEMQLHSNGYSPSACRHITRFADGTVIVVVMCQPTRVYRPKAGAPDEREEIDPRGPDAPAWLRRRFGVALH